MLHHVLILKIYVHHIAQYNIKKKIQEFKYLYSMIKIKKVKKINLKEIFASRRKSIIYQ